MRSTKSNLNTPQPCESSRESVPARCQLINRNPPALQPPAALEPKTLFSTHTISKQRQHQLSKGTKQARSKQQAPRKNSVQNDVVLM